MAQYIEKSALVTEIEKKLTDILACKKDASTPEERIALTDMLHLCKEFLSILNTLEVKDVNEIPASIALNRFDNKYIASWGGLKEYDNFQVGDEITILIPNK